MSESSDAEKLIVGWVGDQKPPTWVDKNAYAGCHHCERPFKRNHKHHCRLCGHMLCSYCSGKYHVPAEFRKKGKTGPVRVCWGCRDQCLARRVRFCKSLTVRPHQKTSFQSGKLHIHPPDWVELDSYSDCWECHARFGGHPYHCRLCGEMFCSTCTLKEPLPDAFCKKGKKGPVRVCGECRYRIKAEAVLDEAPPPRVPELLVPPFLVPQMQEQVSSFGASSLSMASKQQQPRSAKLLSGSAAGATATPGAEVVPEAPSAAAASATAAVSPPPAQPAQLSGGRASVVATQALAQKQLQEAALVQMSVLRAGSSKELTQISVHSPAYRSPGFCSVYVGVPPIQVPKDATLEQIHQCLLEKIPKLRTRAFHYVLRNTPVPPPFFSLFPVECFEGKVTISQGTPRIVVDTGNRDSTKVRKSAQKDSNGVPLDGRFRVRAKFDYDAQADSNVSFKAGQIFLCFKHEEGSQWWFGEVEKQRGWFPASYVEVYKPQPASDVDATSQSVATSSTSVSSPVASSD
ncbi:MAG: hypothetical protein MHM6MM_005966 [Cercozoa sp. M6MM]